MDVLVSQSPTGRYRFYSATGDLLWLGSQDRGVAIAAFSKRYPGLRIDFNPNQPRDSKGRFTRHTGALSNTRPLHHRSVADLQRHLIDAGIDINTLSHKTRKSVLVRAIQVHSKGGSLRESGLLKPTKIKPTRIVKPVKPAPLIEPPDNAVLQHLDVRPKRHGLYDIVHKHSGYNIVSVKGKQDAHKLARSLEANVDMSFTKADADRGEYPRERIQRVIQPVLDASLKTALERIERKRKT